MINLETKVIMPKDIDIAARTLKEGGLVVFPTETVYGLGANALDADAVSKIFEAKGRPADNPLIVHISDYDMLSGLALEIPDKAKTLMENFWPGPLTVILKASDKIPRGVTAGLDTVGIRMPSNAVARELIAKAGVPVAAPSANLSGKPSPTTFEHVYEDMNGRVPVIINGGNCDVGVESTVIDLSGDGAIIYRPGGVTEKQISKLIGEVKTVASVGKDEKVKSPGLKYKHYSPDAEVIVLSGSVEEVEECVKLASKERKVGLLAFDQIEEAVLKDLDTDVCIISMGDMRAAEEAARNLFKALREMDLNGVGIIFAPEIPDSGLWAAVRNRLYRAAGGRVIKASEYIREMNEENAKRGDTNTEAEKAPEAEKAAKAEKSVNSILFVCTGNTCRSPMAEGILRAMAKGTDFKTSSAGLFAGGEPVSKNAVLVMNEIGIDISGHVSRQLTRDMLKEFDLVLTMSESHKNAIVSAFPEYKDKTFTLPEYAGESGGEIPDPFGGDIETYRKCRDSIRKYVNMDVAALHRRDLGGEE